MYPSLIGITVASAQGDISSWDVDFSDVLGSFSEAPSPFALAPSPAIPLGSRTQRAQLLARSFGHRDAVKLIVRHQSLPLVASLDVLGVVVVWWVTNTTSSDTPQVLS